MEIDAELNLVARETERHREGDTFDLCPGASPNHRVIVKATAGVATGNP